MIPIHGLLQTFLCCIFNQVNDYVIHFFDFLCNFFSIFSKTGRNVEKTKKLFFYLNLLFFVIIKVEIFIN